MDAKPEDSDQVNFTDSESRSMLSGGAFVQAYNAQAAVDGDLQVVVAAGVSNQAADVEYLRGLMHETMASTGRIPKNVSSEDRMRRKLGTKKGKRQYRKRQTGVEPVFGYIKEGRGLRQFLNRGLEKNHHLFRFDVAVHNLWKIVRYFQRCLAHPPRNQKGTMSFRSPIASPR